MHDLSHDRVLRHIRESATRSPAPRIPRERPVLRFEQKAMGVFWATLAIIGLVVGAVHFIARWWSWWLA